MPDTDGIGVADTGDNIEKQVPKEQITEIVDRFSQLYEVDLHDASCDFEVDYIKREEWNQKLLEMEISSSIGAQVTLSEADKDNFAKKRDIPLGEWIPGEGKGYLLEMSEEECSKVCQDHILKHEIMHAISLRIGGGFNRRSMLNGLLEKDYRYVKNRRNLSEGATEVLALGLSLNTTDPTEIVKVVKQRIDAIKSSKSEYKELGDMKTYVEESLMVLGLLTLAEISVKEMASYYAKGDFKSFAGKVVDFFNKKYPKESRFEDENYEGYTRFIKYLEYLGMDSVYYDSLKKKELFGWLKH